MINASFFIHQHVTLGGEKKKKGCFPEKLMFLPVNLEGDSLRLY